MFNSLIAATVNKYSQGEPDKNGKDPVILNVLAGKCPNRTVLSGTVAESMGIQIGESYLFQVRETEPDAEYGRRFVYSAAKKLDAMEILGANRELGNAIVFDASKEEDKAPVAPEAKGEQPKAHVTE